MVEIQNKFTEVFFIMPSSKIAQMVPLLNRRAGRAPDKKYLYNTSPSELLVQMQNNFTVLFLLIPSTKIAQMVLLC